MLLKDDKSMVNLGRFGAAVGLKGELRAILYAENSENLYEGSVLLVNTNNKKFEAVKVNDNIREFKVNSIRYQKGKPVIKLDLIEDRNTAETLTNLEFYIPETDLVELDEGRFYFRDLIGLNVRDTNEGNLIGKVSDIVDNPAHSLLEIEKLNGEKTLIPYVDEFIKEVSLEDEYISVALIPGLVD